ncbi:MAG: hypothetical protein AB1456_05450 [Thermodesulfobacteriota bacterium]
MRSALAILSLCLSLAPATTSHAHAIHYRVENRGVSARVFYGPDEPANYAAYEIFGPRDTLPHQKGRTDRNGIVAFLPDRPGEWRITVTDQAEHGAHGATIAIRVDQGLFMASFDKPLVAQHTKAFVGVSILLFAFSLRVLFGNRKRRPKAGHQTGSAQEERPATGQR